MTRPSSALTRRAWLRRVAGASGLAAVGGCSALAGDSGGGRDPRVELLHDYTGGPGQDAMAHLVAGFDGEGATLDVSAVSTTPRTSLDAIVADRIDDADADPPGLWTTTPGEPLSRFVGDLAGLGDDWDAGVASACPDDVAALGRLDGTQVALPFHVHRVNGLFYDVDAVEAAGVDPTALDDTEAFRDALAAVATETDRTPLAHGTGVAWPTLQLWETVLLAEAGPAALRATADGRPDREVVEDALATVDRLLGHVPADSASTGALALADRLAAGEAAFLQSGDWTFQQYADRDGYAHGTDWGFVPVPGTAETYLVATRAFASPAGDPVPDGTSAVREYLASPEAQTRFAARKGSVPARTDAPTERLSPPQREQYAAYREATAHPPSLTHGHAVDRETQAALEGATEAFLRKRDVASATDAFLSALRG